MNTLTTNWNKSKLSIRTSYYSNWLVTYDEFLGDYDLQCEIDQIINDQELNIRWELYLSAQSIELTWTSIAGIKTYFLLNNDVDLLLEYKDKATQDKVDIIKDYIQHKWNEFFGQQVDYWKGKSDIKIWNSSLLDSNITSSVSHSNSRILINSQKFKYILLLNILNPDGVFVIFNQHTLQLALSDKYSLDSAVSEVQWLIFKLQLDIKQTDKVLQLAKSYWSFQNEEVIDICRENILNQNVVKLWVEKRADSIVITTTERINWSDVRAKSLSYWSKQIKYHESKITYIEISNSYKLAKRRPS